MVPPKVCRNTLRHMLKSFFPSSQTVAGDPFVVKIPIADVSKLSCKTGYRSIMTKDGKVFLAHKVKHEWYLVFVGAKSVDVFEYDYAIHVEYEDGWLMVYV